jgi:hypothetical protein
MTYVNISQGQVLRDDMETNKRKDIIIMYQNHKKKPQPIFGTILLSRV